MAVRPSYLLHSRMFSRDTQAFDALLQGDLLTHSIYGPLFFLVGHQRKLFGTLIVD